jgi:hypothetical protein
MAAEYHFVTKWQIQGTARRDGSESARNLPAWESLT